MNVFSINAAHWPQVAAILHFCHLHWMLAACVNTEGLYENIRQDQMSSTI